MLYILFGQIPFYYVLMFWRLYSVFHFWHILNLLRPLYNLNDKVFFYQLTLYKFTLEKWVNVRQKLGTRSLSHSLTASYSLIHSLTSYWTPFVFMSMLKSHSLTLSVTHSHSHTLNVSLSHAHSFTLSFTHSPHAEQLLFSCLSCL